MLNRFPPEKNPRYGENSQANIIKKLAQGKSLTKEQEKIFDRLYKYDKQVIQYLNGLKLTHISDMELESVKWLHKLLLSSIGSFSRGSRLLPFVYRLVKNKSMPNNKNERLTESKFLSYPSLEIVKKINKYGRANTPDFNVFYATENLDGALREMRPEKGDIVTIGKWMNITGERIQLFPIIGDLTSSVYSDSQREKFINSWGSLIRMNERLRNYMLLLINFYSYHFTKTIPDKQNENSHREYYFSAKLTERLLIDQPTSFIPNHLSDSNPFPSEELFFLHSKWMQENFPADENNSEVEGIAYGSVENRLMIENVALKPEVVDRKFRLENVYELTVTKEKYDLENASFSNSSELDIFCVEHTPVVCANGISSHGEIIWD